jgi:hypothetical protein
MKPWLRFAAAGAFCLGMAAPGGRVPTALVLLGRRRVRGFMGSIQGFKCRDCRTEILASPTLRDLRGHPGWTPPVLCCGKPLAPVDCDQILSTMLTIRRFAWCPLCRHRVRLIVQPFGVLTCMICQGPLVVLVDLNRTSPPVLQPV